MRLEEPTESNVLLACVKLLAVRGWLVQRNNTGTFLARSGSRVRAGRVGSSDIYAIIPRSGRWLCVEVKRPGGSESSAQIAFRERMTQLGAVAVVIDDVAALHRLMVKLETDPWMTEI